MAKDSDEQVKIALSKKDDKFFLQYLEPEHQIRALRRTHFTKINERCQELPYSCSLSDSGDGGIVLTGFPSFYIERNETNGHYQIKCESLAAWDLIHLLNLPQMEVLDTQILPDFKIISCDPIFNFDLWYKSVTQVLPAQTSSSFVVQPVVQPLVDPMASPLQLKRRGNRWRRLWG
ncbi:hypothetical protein N7509_009721 [Penicillium cosmopolitanum]|uniref:Uncharacterized protein n=1 Tax=Penicillium cosmopolitanum TaxID=1131564 RepID=A0A9W9VQ32_9EURO|nr:uncharacterized protein N7509_009721 [Penicillium cosmopolitanum]KAJ5387180.1 hypothetical protein N7509_009721 [Penicillium cosmopolitanum]